METDNEREKFKKSVNKIESDKIHPDSQKPKPSPVVRGNAGDSSSMSPSLADQFYMESKSPKSLISKVYNNSGIGAPPISGGKIESKKRGKLFK